MKSRKANSKSPQRGVALHRIVRLSLQDCRTNEEVCSLPRDNFDGKDCWLISDGYEVTITAQKSGEAPSSSVTLPRGEFNRLIRSYQFKQKVKQNAERSHGENNE
jgi:hypothetical protein